MIGLTDTAVAAGGAVDACPRGSALGIRRAGRVALCGCLAVAISAMAPQAVFRHARAQDAASELSAARMMTPSTVEAIDRGLAYLASQQQADGSFDGSGDARSVAVSAIAGMAFLSSGSAPGRGPYGKHVAKCVDYLLENTQESGFITLPDGRTHGPMYGHGFASLFFG